MAKQKTIELNENNVASKVINSQFNKNPALFEEWRGGPYWDSNIELECFIDAIMHLLFLGVTKTSKQYLDIAIKKSSVNARKSSKRENCYHIISKWGLDWLKVIDYKSGWVSENYLGFCRIIKWYYVHDMNCEMNSSNETESEHTYYILRFLATLYSMISSIMTDYTNEREIQDCENKIKSFLSDLNNLDKSINAKTSDKVIQRRKPIWLSKYNFQSLMNLPTTMRKFGPLRNYWEGSMQGEGYLKLVKPKIDNLKTKNWHVNAHTKLMEDRLLDRVLLDFTLKDGNDTSFLEYNRMKYIRKDRQIKMMQSYKCVDDVYSLMNKGSPLSFVQLKDNSYKIILKHGRQCDMVSIHMKLKYIGIIRNVNMNLHAIQIDRKEKDRDLQKVLQDEMKCYFIGLPVKLDYADEYNMYNSLYYVISASWMEVDENGMIMKPRI